MAALGNEGLRQNFGNEEQQIEKQIPWRCFGSKRIEKVQNGDAKPKFGREKSIKSIPFLAKSQLGDASIEAQFLDANNSRIGEAKVGRLRDSANTNRNAREPKILEDNFNEIRDEHVVLNHDVCPKVSTKGIIDVDDVESHEENEIEQIPVASGNGKELDTPTNHHEEIRETHVASNHVVGLEVLKEDLMKIEKRDGSSNGNWNANAKGMDCERHATTEARSEGNHIRVRNHGAIGREMEDHVVCATRRGAIVDDNDKHKQFPWFVTRIICNWLTQNLEQDGNLYWNIDDYDGEESYLERNIATPIEYERDPEIEPYQYQRLRQKLIGIEDWQRDKGFGYPDSMIMTEEVKAEMVSMILKKIREIRDVEYKKTMCEDKQNMTRNLRKPSGQSYATSRWKQNGLAQLACFTKGRGRRAPVGQRNDDEESEEKSDGMVCHMTSDNRGQLPFLITIDSGACTSVMSTRWCSHVPTKETSESKADEFFRAANGEQIYNEGKETTYSALVWALGPKTTIICCVLKHFPRTTSHHIPTTTTTNHNRRELQPQPPRASCRYES